jgi:hypothetical protein
MFISFTFLYQWFVMFVQFAATGTTGAICPESRRRFFCVQHRQETCESRAARSAGCLGIFFDAALEARAAAGLVLRAA